MYYMEDQGPGRICLLQTKEQRIQTQIPQKTFGPEQRHLYLGSAWKG